MDFYFTDLFDPGPLYAGPFDGDDSNSSEANNSESDASNDDDCSVGTPDDSDSHSGTSNDGDVSSDTSDDEEPQGEEDRLRESLEDPYFNWHFRSSMVDGRDDLLKFHQHLQFSDITKKWLYENVRIQHAEQLKGFLKFVQTDSARFVQTLAIIFDGESFRPFRKYYKKARNLLQLKQVSLSLPQNDDTWLRRWVGFLQKLPAPLERLELRPVLSQCRVCYHLLEAFFTNFFTQVTSFKWPYWTCDDFGEMIQKSNAKVVFLFTNGAQVPTHPESTEDIARGHIIIEDLLREWTTPVGKNGMVLETLIVTNDDYYFEWDVKSQEGTYDSPYCHECWVWDKAHAYHYHFRPRPIEYYYPDHWNL